MSGGGIFFSLANVYYASKQSYLFFIVIFILLCKLKLKKMLNVIYFYNLLYLARQGHHFAAVHRTTDPRSLHPSDIRETLWSCSLWFGTFWSHSFLIFKHIPQAHSTKKGGRSVYCSAVIVVVPQFWGSIGVLSLLFIHYLLRIANLCHFTFFLFAQICWSYLLRVGGVPFVGL